MRLHGLERGRLYGSDGRRLLVEDADASVRSPGRLPLPGAGRDGLVHRALADRPWRSALRQLVGTVATVNVWALTESDLLATVGRSLLVSRDGGRGWTRSRQLPPSSGPMGILPTGACHHDGTTYLGEYPLDGATTPRILRSRDRGASWSTAARLPDVRHVHAVQADPYGGELWVTTGDADDESRIGRLRDGSLDAVGGGDQRWRAVELVFTPTAVLWGMDCAYADSNRIFKLPHASIGTDDPTPEPVHTVPGSVYYGASLDVDGERWVLFSTAMEPGRDSTGPERQRVDPDTPGVVVAASSASGYTEWHEIASYRRYHPPAERLPGTPLPRTTGYVFVDADDARGAFLNPYNVASAHGEVHRVPPEWFARRA